MASSECVRHYNTGLTLWSGSGPGDCTWLTDTHSRLATAHSALTLDTHTDPASSECRALPEANHTQELSNLKH